MIPCQARPDRPPFIAARHLREFDFASQNIADDVDHCLKAGTSLHLAEMATGNRNFVSGTLVDVMERKFTLDHDRPRIFSPFGLGVLDVAVGSFVLEVAKASGTAMALPDFFSNSARW